MMSDVDLMRAAIQQALAARALDEVPIGCVVYHPPTGRMLGVGHNRRILDSDPTAHAEILAIRAAAAALGDWRLENTVLAVTLEPCPMCAGAIVNARIPRLVYGAADPKAGAVDSLYSLCADKRLNHRVEVASGILAGECGGLLTQFFASKRAMGRK